MTTQQGALVVEQGPYSKRGDTAVQLPQPQAGNLMQAIANAASNPNMDIAKVKELWAMHCTMMQREAEQAFNDAMARAQQKIEPITRDRRNEHTKSMYATLAAINEQVVPIYSAEGLSISFDTYAPERDKDLPALRDGWIRVIALASHAGGHTRKYHLDGPLDDAGKDGTKNKTGIQAAGSTVSYLRRYLVCMIFNISTEDDNDGNAASVTASANRLSEAEIAALLKPIDSAPDRKATLAAFAVAYNKAEDLKDKAAQRIFLQHRDEHLKTLK